VAQLYHQAPSTHFSRLLRHAWATVGLFFSPVTTRGAKQISLLYIIFQHLLNICKYASLTASVALSNCNAKHEVLSSSVNW
jgi:hypothetical protein